MFNPDTMKDEYHVALKQKLERNLISDNAKKRVLEARKKHPDCYMSLASLAYEETDNAFRLGVRIFMDALYLTDFGKDMRRPKKKD